MLLFRLSRLMLLNTGAPVWVGSLQTANVPGATSQSSQFELVDLSGRILKVIPVAPNTSQVQINTSGLHKGVYKLVWSDGKHTSYKTILVL